jgi:hypothetical protein
MVVPDRMAFVSLIGPVRRRRNGLKERSEVTFFNVEIPSSSLVVNSPTTDLTDDCWVEA